VRSSQAGRVRVAEVDVDTGGDGDVFPVAHLRALVPGQRQAQRLRQRLDLRGQSVADLFGLVTLGQVQQHRVTGLAFDQGADRG